MARKIAVVCCWLGLLSPLGVHALGLGDIHVRSALNQPLDAEVELISATSVELDELEISLASRETFERNGLDRPGYLSGLRFDVSRGARGEAVLRVTTDRPVSEPFLTFLIEAKWPRGRLLREYTVLLDPPVYLRGDAAQAEAVERSERRFEPEASTAGPITRRSDTQSAAAPRNAPPAGVRSGEYGPVQANETLWTIADRLRAGTGASVNQMMIALYRSNPEAFGGNINLLLAGAVLEVPGASAIDSLAAREANDEVARQNSLWQESSRTAAADAAPEGGRLRLVPPAEEIIAAGGESGSGGSAAQAAGSEGDPEALRREVAELESRLEEAERLVELKDSELAALQSRLAELEGEPVAAAEDSPGTPGVDLETEAAESPAGETATPEEAAPAERTTPAAAATPPPATIDDGGGFGETLAGIFGSMWLYVGVGIALLLGALLVFAQRRREPAQITGRWQSFDDEDEAASHAPRAAATQTVRAIPEPDESIVVVEQKPVGTVRREAPAAARGESLAARAEPAVEADDEDTQSSATAVHLDQADPLAEADFHMAYGLYDQAADLVRKASRQEPGRRDLRMKLLEIYFVWGNEQAFLEEAQQLNEAMGGSPDADWDKILIMGKQICPDEPLFAGEPGSSAAGSGAVDLELADASGDSTVDFVTEGEQEDSALDLDLGDSADAEDSRAAARADDDLLDFDFGEDQEEEPREEGSTIEASGFESPTVETPTIEQAGPESPTIEQAGPESPTIEQAGPESPTVESPTIESARYEDSTVETPTIEQRIDAARGTAASDQTAEIDLYDLGLDLENLRGDENLDGPLADSEETMLADMSGFEESDEAGESDEEEFDAALTTPAGTAAREFDETAEVPAFGTETSGRRDLDDTSEFAAPDVGALDIDLEDLSAALESSDTVEQPRPAGGDTVRQRQVGTDDTQQVTTAGEEFLDMDLTEMLGDENVGSAGAADFNLDDLDETESEVGTKLDLARAYMDMGDPEGANSILQEVLEEGDASQREEAQRLLNALP